MHPEGRREAKRECLNQVSKHHAWPPTGKRGTRKPSEKWRNMSSGAPIEDLEWEAADTEFISACAHRRSARVEPKTQHDRKSSSGLTWHASW